MKESAFGAPLRQAGEMLKGRWLFVFPGDV